MKKFYLLTLLTLVALVFSSCGLFNNKPEYKLSDLQGLWHETNSPDLEHYVRFTTEQSDETGFLLGREWDEAEDIYESDLLEAREELGHPGNGWFKYKFETTGDLTEIHLQDNGGAEIPKVYVVSKLTDTDLEYYEEEHKNIKFSFSKVVQSK